MSDAGTGPTTTLSKVPSRSFDRHLLRLYVRLITHPRTLMLCLSMRPFSRGLVCISISVSLPLSPTCLYRSKYLCSVWFLTSIAVHPCVFPIYIFYLNVDVLCWHVCNLPLFLSMHLSLLSIIWQLLRTIVLS